MESLQSMTFEQCMEELEKIVKELELGGVPLSQMVKLYERGVLLGKRCTDELESYEGKLALFEQGEG